MSLRTKNFAGYALVAPSHGQVSTKNFVGYALITPAPGVPKGGNAHDLLVDQIKAAASRDLEGTQLILGAPGESASGPAPTNTSLHVEAEGDDVEGTADFFYKRRSLADIWTWTSPMSIYMLGKTRTVDLLNAIADQTGVQLVVGDIVDEPLVVTNGMVTLKAAATSYFFVPGSTINIVKSKLIPILDYRFEDPTNQTVVKNVADGSMPGTRVGSAAGAVPGKVGNGWNLGAATTIATGIKTPAGPVSFSAFVTPAVLTGRQTIVGDADSAGSVTSARLHFAINGANFEFQVGDGTATACTGTVAHGMVVGRQYQVGYKIKADGSLVTIYRDGAPIGTLVPTKTRPAGESPNAMSIGQSGAYNALRLNAAIDQVKIWNVELANEEFMDLFNETVSSNPGQWSTTDINPGGAVIVSADQRVLNARNYQSGRAAKSRSTGKRMFEVTDTLAPRFGIIGVAVAAASLTVMPGGDANGWGYYSNNGNKLSNNTSSAFGAAYAVGDIIGVVVDFDAGTVTFYKNGVSQGVAFTGLQGKTLFPIAGSGSTGSSLMGFLLNYGDDGFAFPIEGVRAW